MGKPLGNNKLENMTTQAQTAALISKGMSRKDVCDWLETQGMQRKNAYTVYYSALKELVPEDNLLDDHKRFLIQQNLDRLETIINTSITGNTGEKKVALQAIDTLNKMLGVYQDGNKVMIAKNNQGDEIIQISFDK